MPTSMVEGKSWLLPRIVRELPGTVLDIGAGEGTYSKLLGPHRPKAHMIGVEVFAPYVETYGLEGLYDELIVGDARDIEFPEADVVILGDVIEHMSLDDAVAVWAKARSAARRAVLASLPLGHFPQGAVNGNEHERHLVTWTHDLVLSTLDGITESWIENVIGVYAAS